MHIWLGQAAEKQTFVGGLSVYELSCWSFLLWPVKKPQSGKPSFQTGNKPTTTGDVCALDWAGSVLDLFEIIVHMGTVQPRSGT